MAKYSTTFATDQDPLSTPWQARVNTVLTDMKALSGQAIAKALGIAAYDDSAALLTGYGNDTEITATVFKDAGIDTDATHECELLHRASQTTTISTQYESLFSFNGNVQCFRWYNNGGSQDFEVQTALLGTEVLGREFVTGDRIRARIAGSVITMWVIDGGGTITLLGLYSNTAITSGQPGIGGFIRSLDGGDASKFCFNDAQVSDVFVESDQVTDDCARSNETPISNGGAWATVTSLNQLDLISNKIQTHTADSNSGMRYTGVSTDPDHFAEIVIGTVGGGDFGPACCILSNGDLYFVTNFDAASLYLVKYVGGSFSIPEFTAGSYANSDVINIGRFGSSIRVYQNGTLKMTLASDITNLGGSFGIFGYDGTHRINSFTGGRIVADYDAVPGSSTTTSTLTSNLLANDSFIFSTVRGISSADTFSVTDQSFFNLLRAAILEDRVIFSDELRYRLILNRLHEDGYVVNDGTIVSLTASQIISLVATSLAVFSDEAFLFLLRSLSGSDLIAMADSALVSAERGVYTSDSYSVSDQVQPQLQLTRELISPINFADAQFNFQLLTRQLQSLLSLPDSSIAQVSDNTPALVDGSQIRLSFQRPSIVLGANNIVRIR